MTDRMSSDLASLKIDRGAGAPSRRTPRVGPLVWFVLLGAGGYGAYVFGLPYVESRVFKQTVELTEITTYSPMQQSVELTSTGYVQPQLVTRVSPKLPGRVSAVHVREGDRVEQGQLLVELEKADREAAIAAARARAAAVKARVATARANLAETEQQAKRERALAEQGVSPRVRADDLEARVASLGEAARAAAAEVSAAEAEIEALRVDLRYTKVVAPIGGTVINKPPEVGELIGLDTGLGDRTIELADFDTLLVETDIPEGRLHLVKLGSPCEIILDAFPKRRFRGEAVEISPRVNRAKATVQVKVKFTDDAEGVLPDMSARVSFLMQELDEEVMRVEPAPVIPASAVTERSGARVVFVVEDGRARMRTVELGEPLGGGLRVVSGPPPGTTVVNNPAPLLADGVKVKDGDE